MGGGTLRGGTKKPAGWVAGGLVVLESRLAFNSGRSGPPAWMSHGDGGDRDGGCSASVYDVKGKGCAVSTGKFAFRRSRWIRACSHYWNGGAGSRFFSVPFLSSFSQF